MSKSRRVPRPRPRIVLEFTEHARLIELADRAHPPVAEFLLEELSRSFIVPDGACATNVVRMGSHVTYREDSTARVRRVTLTYPQQADIAESRISILTPVGAALIGMSIAQTIEWPTPDGGMERITVLDIVNDAAARE